MVYEIGSCLCGVMSLVRNIVAAMTAASESAHMVHLAVAVRTVQWQRGLDHGETENVIEIVAEELVVEFVAENIDAVETVDTAEHNMAAESVDNNHVFGFVGYVVTHCIVAPVLSFV